MSKTESRPLALRSHLKASAFLSQYGVLSVKASMKVMFKRGFATSALQAEPFSRGPLYRLWERPLEVL